MGENLDIEGRMSVRTPMQWTPEKNAGFSDAPRPELRRPLPEGEYGPDAVNVEDQRRDPESLLNWMERMIRRRRETPEFGWGRWSVLDTGDDAVLAHRCDWEGRTVLALHNLADDERRIELRLADTERDCVLVDLLDLDVDPVSDVSGAFVVDLDEYGYRWLRLRAV